MTSACVRQSLWQSSLQGDSVSFSSSSFCHQLYISSRILSSNTINIFDLEQKLQEGIMNLLASHCACQSCRWFPKDKVETREAKFLDVILYSREQILKEREAMPEEEQQDLPDAPWGIISIKAQVSHFKQPTYCWIRRCGASSTVTIIENAACVLFCQSVSDTTVVSVIIRYLLLGIDCASFNFCRCAFCILSQTGLKYWIHGCGTLVGL